MGMIMRLGIVGSGNIVKCCIDAVQQTDSVQIVALCVLERNIETGKLLQSEHHIDRLYTNYEQFLADPEIDFVYLGIPNSLHFPYSLKALQADKHLICEKPFTTDLNELKQLADLAKAKRRFLFEAITTIYSPNVCWIKEHLNEIGQISVNNISGSPQDVERVVALKADEQGASWYRIIQMQEDNHIDHWRVQAILYA